jgi:asparagine N-glycosylation enzyme membrane subunit Stt3
MKAKIARVIELSFFQLSLLFFLLVLLKEFHILSLNISYQLLAYLLPLFALPILLKFKPAEERKLTSVWIILLAVFLFALCIRFLPYIHSQAPLGYDAGIYKYTIELYANNLPQIPETTLPLWVREMTPQGLPVLADTLHTVAGTNATQLLHYLFPILGAFLVFPVFILTRSFFGERTGLIASVLYAVSYTQFTTFTFLYFKQVLGLIFLLFALYALEKKRYVLLALMFAALGIFHRPEFLLLALILIPYLIIKRDWRVLYSAAGTAALIAPFWLLRLDINLGMLQGAFTTAVTNIQTGVAAGGGTFPGLDSYQQMALAYLPFALIGAIYLITKKSWNSLFFYFVINLAIVIFQFLFFNRYIISLDVAMVILAALGINVILLHRQRNSKKVWSAVNIVVIIMIIVASGVPTVIQANSVEPLINDEQLHTIEWLAQNTEPDAYILASTYDAPWVLGWSNRRVIAPGLFHWNEHNKQEWFDFFETDDLREVKQFLNRYRGTIYIYYSRNEGNYLGLEKFDNECFIEIQDAQAVVYKYVPNGDSGRR